MLLLIITLKLKLKFDFSKIYPHKFSIVKGH